MSFIAKKVGRKYFAGQAAAMEPADPHYETYLDARGKTRSRKRQMPTGLSKKEARILKSVRRRAHYLDKGFSLCGFRFGWTAIFGLIPFLGDIIGFLLGYLLVLRKCRQADLPQVLQSRMVANQMIGSGIGLVPLVGDIVAAVYKANSRNAALLEEFLIARSKAGTDAEAAAREALSTASISGKTGERPGTNDFSGEFAKGSSENLPSNSTYGTNSVAASDNTPKIQPQQKKYGWGSGGNASSKKDLDQKPLTQASMANGQSSRT